MKEIKEIADNLNDFASIVVWTLFFGLVTGLGAFFLLWYFMT
jgi:hypothetical protein